MPPLRRSARTASRRGKVVAVSGARQEDGGHAIHPGIASRSPRFNVHATHVHARHGQQLRQSARSSMTYAPGSVATTTETIPEYAPSIPIPLMSMQGDDAYMEDDRIHCSAADDPLYSSCTMMPMKVVEDMACTAYAHAPAYALLAPPPSNLISPSVASSQEQQQQQHATTFFQQSPPETPSMLFGAVTTPPSTSSSSLSAPFLDFPPLPTKFDCRSPNVLRTPPQTPASLQPAEYGSHSAFPYVATLQPTAQLIRAISLEHETIVDSGYLQHQRIKPEHRRHWFHWFTQVAIDMDYHPETACVALNFFDRYLADNRIVQQRQFHLLSITCLFVAAKMEEEILEPLCSDMLKHVGMPTTGKELRRMEKKLLGVLGWKLVVVTPQAIIFELLKSMPEVLGSREQQLLLCRTQPLIDRALADAALIGIAPSIIGAACLVAALEKLQQECIFHPHSIFADPSGVLYMVTEVLAGAYTTPLDIADAVRACLAAICG